MSNTDKYPAESDMTVSEGAATTCTNAGRTPFSPWGTDLRMDWENWIGKITRGCSPSLGYLPDVNQNLVLIIDQDTECFVSFLTKN